MKVEKILIKDFRSHKITKVTFTSGINLIVGQNGSGKARYSMPYWWVSTGPPSPRTSKRTTSSG